MHLSLSDAMIHESKFVLTKGCVWGQNFTISLHFFLDFKCHESGWRNLEILSIQLCLYDTLYTAQFKRKKKGGKKGIAPPSLCVFNEVAAYETLVLLWPAEY